MINTALLAICIIVGSYVLVSHAAVQKAPEVSFFAEYVTTFDYQSHTRVAIGINLTLSAQVSKFVCLRFYLSAVMETRG